MKRILIIGSSGSGKSTLSKKVAAITGLELYHLDQLYWKPNWVESEKEAWRKIIQEVTDRESWIMDGNYSGTYDIRMPKADTIIWLDIPMPICLWQTLKRIASNYGKTRDDMAPGCPERLDLKFLGYVTHFPIVHRPRIVKAIKKLNETQRLIIFKSNKEANNFLGMIK